MTSWILTFLLLLAVSEEKPETPITITTVEPGKKSPRKLEYESFDEALLFLDVEAAAKLAGDPGQRQCVNAVDAILRNDIAGAETTLLALLAESPEYRLFASTLLEQIYFADPSSAVFGQNVHLVRVAMGRRVAVEAPVDADLVVPIPTCAQCAAIGYAEQSGIPQGRAFTTSHYLGRSFIMPTQSGRDMAVKMKLSVIEEAVKGQRLVVVEDGHVANPALPQACFGSEKGFRCPGSPDRRNSRA